MAGWSPDMIAKFKADMAKKALPRSQFGVGSIPQRKVPASAAAPAPTPVYVPAAAAAAAAAAPAPTPVYVPAAAAAAAAAPTKRPSAIATRYAKNSAKRPTETRKGLSKGRTVAFYNTVRQTRIPLKEDRLMNGDVFTPTTTNATNEDLIQEDIVYINSLMNIVFKNHPDLINERTQLILQRLFNAIKSQLTDKYVLPSIAAVIILHYLLNCVFILTFDQLLIFAYETEKTEYLSGIHMFKSIFPEKMVLDHSSLENVAKQIESTPLPNITPIVNTYILKTIARFTGDISTAASKTRELFAAGHKSLMDRLNRMTNDDFLATRKDKGQQSMLDAEYIETLLPPTTPLPAGGAGAINAPPPSVPSLSFFAPASPAGGAGAVNAPPPSVQSLPFFAPASPAGGAGAVNAPPPSVSTLLGGKILKKSRKSRKVHTSHKLRTTRTSRKSCKSRRAYTSHKLRTTRKSRN